MRIRFSLLARVYSIGSISECHVDQAVTVGLLMNGKFESGVTGEGIKW
jgi:hypothetical protein